VNVKLIERLIIDLEHMYGPGAIRLRPQTRGTITSGLTWICSWEPDRPMPTLVTSGIGAKSREVPVLLSSGGGKDPEAAISHWVKQTVAMMRDIRVVI